MGLFHRLPSSTRKLILLLVASLLPTGCTQAASPDTRTAGQDARGFDILSLPAPELPAGISAIHSPFGAYIAGNIATYSHDDKTALAYYQAALIERPGSTTILGRTFILSVINGRFDIAVPLARRLAVTEPNEPLANFVLLAEALKTVPATPATLADAATSTKALPEDGFYRFAKPMANAWTQVAGWHGTVTVEQEKSALAALAKLPAISGLTAVQALHAALIADLAGDAASAETQYQVALQAGDNAFRIVQLYGNFLARHGKPGEARALYRKFAASQDDRYGAIPSDIAANPEPVIRNAADGMAEALFDLSSLVMQANAPDLALLSARLALQLRPDLGYARVLLANTLIVTGRVDDAATILRSIDPATRLGRTAQLTTAQLLIARNKPEQAEALLKPLVAAVPQAIDPQVSLADALSAEHRYAEAAHYYRNALELLGPAAPGPARGQLMFSLGVTYEQSDHWQEAEQTLRQALKLAPANAALLNYLGYALVERDQNLPEAVHLIQAALERAPRDGYYTDSLGWAYYHQHLYAKAAETLERAATLRPADAEINDHLGDAYWHAGRHDEARIAWRRALTYQPSSSLADAIGHKLRDTPPAKRQKPHALPAATTPVPPAKP
jgi:tetratricopeptide (TPR) repeat protein